MSILSVLRHLNYKPWFALAEFVDNSLQSYLDDRAALESLHGRDFQLRVRIDIESLSYSPYIHKRQCSWYRGGPVFASF